MKLKPLNKITQDYYLAYGRLHAKHLAGQHCDLVLGRGFQDKMQEFYNSLLTLSEYVAVSLFSIFTCETSEANERSEAERV